MIGSRCHTISDGLSLRDLLGAADLSLSLCSLVPLTLSLSHILVHSLSSPPRSILANNKCRPLPTCHHQPVSQLKQQQQQHSLATPSYSLRERHQRTRNTMSRCSRTRSSYSFVLCCAWYCCSQPKSEACAHQRPITSVLRRESERRERADIFESKAALLSSFVSPAADSSLLSSPCRYVLVCLLSLPRPTTMPARLRRIVSRHESQRQLASDSESHQRLRS